MMDTASPANDSEAKEEDMKCEPESHLSGACVKEDMEGDADPSQVECLVDAVGGRPADQRSSAVQERVRLCTLEEIGQKRDRLRRIMQKHRYCVNGP